MMNDAANKRILLVEDDTLFATSVKTYLEAQGLKVEVEGRGDTAVKRILALKPDAVVLDCILPGKDGFDVCREVRPDFHGPILMLTARNEDIDQMLGLGLGADAYLVKPVTPHLLLAHLRASLRRTDQVVEVAEGADKYRFGKFHISRATRSVRLAGEAISFSTAEFDLLWLLTTNAGKVLSRDDINTALRQLEYDGLDRTIDMRVSRLRKRLGDDADNPVRIKTVRGKGYLFSRDDWG